MSQDPELPPAIIVSGGIVHDFEQSSAELSDILAESGFTSTITEDVESAFRTLPSATDRPLVVLNLLRFRLELDRYAHLREQWALSLSEQARDGLTTHIRNGGGLLAMHGAAICFDDWPQWRRLLGAGWKWGESNHPPLSVVPIAVRTDEHPIVAGISDFEIEDEVYGFLELEDDVEGLLFSPHGGADHPLLWARHVDSGRVVYDALGHHVTSLRQPKHRVMVGRSALWAAGALDG